MTDDITIPERFTVAEAKLYRLEQLKKQVTNGWRATAEALSEIKTSQLYKLECPTFEEFCEINWGFTVRRAEQLMKAGETANELEMRTDVRVPNEATARALLTVDENDRVEVLEAANATGTVSAPSIQDAKRKLEGGRREKKYQPDYEDGYITLKIIIQDAQRRNLLHKESITLPAKAVSMDDIDDILTMPEQRAAQTAAALYMEAVRSEGQARFGRKIFK